MGRLHRHGDLESEDFIYLSELRTLASAERVSISSQGHGMGI